VCLHDCVLVLASSDDEGGLNSVPRELSSTRLNGHLHYEKSVDEMLEEAARMRVDLSAKRASREKEKNKR